MFGNSTISIVGIKDGKIFSTQKIGDHERDAYYHSDPIVTEDNKLMVLGNMNILSYQMDDD